VIQAQILRENWKGCCNVEIMKPLVTALIDTYNHERYIEQAITSVLDQGLSAEELEIVVVDDGSTDGTSSIIQKFAPTVKHLRKKNGGQASAFNAGFAESRGEIIALLDGDDWWAKGKLKRVVEALEKNPDVSAVSHGYFEFHEDTQESLPRVPAGRSVLSVATPPAIGAALSAWPYLLMGALTVRRKLLEWIVPISEDLIYMADSAIQVAAMVKGTLVLEEPLFYYRHHGQNFFAINPENRPKLRRKFEMTELMYQRVTEMLVARGVDRETVGELIDRNWVAVARQSLQEFGGSSLRTFATEMRAFRRDFKNPSIAYVLFKYGVTGAPMLLLPPRVFYRLRDWYAKRNLGRVRDRLVKARTQ
jgi:glycosyltransferase involved in cell wall biosynthesis